MPCRSGAALGSADNLRCPLFLFLLVFRTRAGEFEELDQQDEGGAEARSGGHQPDHIQRVIRLEAGVAGYAGKTKQAHTRSEDGHPNLNAPHAPLTLLSFGALQILWLARTHGVVLVK